MPLDIVDKPGCISKSEMRELFELAVKNTSKLKGNTPLGILEVNGEFSHYMDADTDTLWLGFALGLRSAERIQKEKLKTT